VLAACGKPAWQVTREDVDRVVGGLAQPGLATSTRCGYVQAFKGSHGFVLAPKATEIEALFGVPGRSAGRVQRLPPCRRQRLAADDAATDIGAAGGVLRLPQPDR
ncbi:MAG: hypothetical protein ABWZ30_01600, partial [Jiangellaceae bacterium]